MPTSRHLRACRSEKVAGALPALSKNVQPTPDHQAPQRWGLAVTLSRQACLSDNVRHFDHVLVEI